MKRQLARWNWTVDEFVDSKTVMGKCPEGHSKRFSSVQIRRLNGSGPVCGTCNISAVSNQLAQWGWTLDRYDNNKAVWGKCSQGHKKCFRARSLKQMKERPVCSACVSAEMAALLDKWGWTLDRYENVQKLWGSAPAELLIAPDWSNDGNRIMQLIEQELSRRGTRQGSRS